MRHSSILGLLLTVLGGGCAHQLASTNPKSATPPGVSFRLTLQKPGVLPTSADSPSKIGFLLRTDFANNGGRQINTGMCGVRIFKGGEHGWKAGYTIFDHPDLLLFSDSLIAKCPPSICVPEAQRADSIQLREMSSSVELEPGASYPMTYGPYFLNKAELPQEGVMLQAICYIKEKDDGDNCQVAGPPRVAGAFPIYCPKSHAGDPNCYRMKGCNKAEDLIFFSLP